MLFELFFAFMWKSWLWLVSSVTCTGAGTSSCRRPTTRAGASASLGVMRRATGSSRSSSKPLCLEHRLTLMDASSKLTTFWLPCYIIRSCIFSAPTLITKMSRGFLRCGDEIVAVNGATTVGMNNSSLIPMLKLQKNKVTLTVVSWPGSLV